MSAHTPGPWIGVDPKTKKFRSSHWRVENDMASCTVSAPIKAGRNTVAIVVTDGFDGIDELQANARLIAAAPELLEAAKSIDTFFVFFDSMTPPDIGNGARQALQMIRDAIKKAEAAK